MTEPTTETTITADDPTFDLEAWLNGATLAQESVDILGRPDLLGRYAEWQRRADRQSDEEESLADKSLKKEGLQILADLEASRTTWYLRAMTSDDEKAINAAHPMPERPTFFEEKPPAPVHSPTEMQAKAFVRSYDSHKEREARFNVEHEAEHMAFAESWQEVSKARGVEKLVRCLVRIEQAGKTVSERITAEQAYRLETTIGATQVKKLLDAIDEATTNEPEVPVGFLSES